MNTKHKTDCKRVFNRYDQSCPRCLELKSGAKARPGWSDYNRKLEAQRIAAIKAHDCKRAGCGPVCTAFDW